MQISINLGNEAAPTKEEYHLALARLVNEYATSDPLCAKALLAEIGYSEQAIEVILYTAEKEAI